MEAHDFINQLSYHPLRIHGAGIYANIELRPPDLPGQPLGEPRFAKVRHGADPVIQ